MIRDRPTAALADTGPPTIEKAPALASFRRSFRSDQPETIRETPLIEAAGTGLVTMIAKAPAVTVIEAALVVPRLVERLRTDTDAAFALHAAFTPVKLTAETWYSRAVALQAVL